MFFRIERTTYSERLNPKNQSTDSNLSAEGKEAVGQRRMLGDL